MWLLSDKNPAAQAMVGLYQRLEWAVNDMDAVLTGGRGRPRLPVAALLGTAVLVAGTVLLFLVGAAWELVAWGRMITPRKMVYGFLMLSTLALTITALDFFGAGPDAEDEFIRDE